MDLLYLLSIDPIYRQLSKYLSFRDGMVLQSVSRNIQEAVATNPNTWKRLDFTGRSRDVIIHYLQSDSVPGALQDLILDCSDVSEMTIAVILTRCINLRHLGLGGCTDLMDGVLQAVFTARKNGYASRLKSVGLLGAPYFKTTGVSGNAASIVRDLHSCGLQTDLVQCPQGHAFTSDPTEQWHLCTPTPSSCVTCHKTVRGCYPCINGRTCRGCFKFWCYDCESPISRVCYECKNSTEDLNSPYCSLTNIL